MMKSLFWVPVGFALLGALLFGGKFFFQKPDVSGILFSTLVAGDRNSSIAEKETATNFFSETIVGWTHSPSFRKEVLKDQQGSFTGEKQERQNIVFTLSSPTVESAERLSQNLQTVLYSHLSEVNKKSETSYILIFSPLETSSPEIRPFWGIVSGAIFGGVFGSFFLMLWQWGKKRLRTGKRVDFSAVQSF